MIKTLLFDLDGTLLGIDMRIFLQKYFISLSSIMTEYIPQEVFIPKLMSATEEMIKNDEPTKTNKEVFIDSFFTDLALTPKELMPIFDNFYKNNFPTLEKYSQFKPSAPPLLESAINLGYEIVIATNPVFPKEAIFERLKWAGVSNFKYALVTSYENMHYCKPNLNYYWEILRTIEREPQECVMIGNDVDEDMVAKNIEMQTYLVDDFLINRSNTDYSGDYKGDLKEVEKVITKLKEEI